MSQAESRERDRSITVRTRLVYGGPQLLRQEEPRTLRFPVVAGRGGIDCGLGCSSVAAGGRFRNL